MQGEEYQCLAVYFQFRTIINCQSLFLHSIFMFYTVKNNVVLMLIFLSSAWNFKSLFRVLIFSLRKIWKQKIQNASTSLTKSNIGLCLKISFFVIIFFLFEKKIISHQSREHSSGRHVMWSQAFDLPFSTTLSTVRAGVPLISGGFFTSQK